MGDLDLRSIRGRLERASAGPWHASRPTSVFHGSHVIAGSMPSYGDESGLGPTEADRNAEFIAHAREDVPALLNEVERLRCGIASFVVDWQRFRGPGGSWADIDKAVKRLIADVGGQSEMTDGGGQ